MPSSSVINKIGVESSNPTDWEVGRVVNAAVGLFTVASGFRMIVTGRMQLDATGSNAAYGLAVKRGAVYSIISKFAILNEIVHMDSNVIMEEGDILTVVGETGSTNGTCDLTIVKLKVEKTT